MATTVILYYMAILFSTLLACLVMELFILCLPKVPFIKKVYKKQCIRYIHEHPKTKQVTMKPTFHITVMLGNKGENVEIDSHEHLSNL